MCIRDRYIGRHAGVVGLALMEAAKKSIVLLKNESELLPLKKRNQTVAIIGQLANDKNSPLGNWRSQVEYNSAVSVVEGMNRYKGNKILLELLILRI